HLAGHGGHLVGEGGEGVDHAVDRVGEGGDFALGFHGQLLLEVTVGDGGHDLGDTAHLAGQVAGHAVDVIGEVLPGAGDALDVGLAAPFAFGAHLAGHAGHFRGKGTQLIHHRVDGVLEFQDFAADIDGDLLGQVAIGHGGGDLGDVAHLGGQ